MSDTSDLTERGDLRFEVDAALLFQLGEQLVARRPIALSELIKNAYDADATRVAILLENVKQADGTIVIDDDGTGMTFEQVRDYWMRIATDQKVQNSHSPIYGRPRTGAKGIGRFAVRRLANALTLHSVAVRPNGTKERTVVRFNWHESFASGQTLTDIPVRYERTIVPADTPTGVMLYLEQTRDAWSEEDVEELHKDLLTLTNPFPIAGTSDQQAFGQANEDPRFAIILEAPEFPGYEGELGEQFLEAAWGVLTGECDSEGIPHYRLEIREPSETVTYSPAHEVFGGLTDAAFKLYFFVYKSDYLHGIPLTVREAQKKGREQGGVRIYLDGFRVFPYGDPGDDWLKLNQMRAGRTRHLVATPLDLQEMEGGLAGRPFLLTPGNNQLFGAVAISRLKQPGIEINISRERLVENQSFDQLRRFLQLGIYWMTLQYARVTEADRRSRADRGPKAASADEILGDAQNKVVAASDLATDQKEELVHILQTAREAVQRAEEEHMSEVSILRVLSSTGAMVAILNHQLRAIVDGMRSVHTDLRELRPFVASEVITRFDGLLSTISEWRQLVTLQVNQLGFLLGVEARTRRRRLALREVVENVAKPLSLYIRDFGIDFVNAVPANLRTPALFEAELHAVLLHTLTNALKAVQNQETRRITVTADWAESAVHIRMLDTGIGVEPDRREDVFQPFVTTSAPDPILGVGTGLGLTVVRNILETYAGTARFVDAPDPWSTCLEIVLPERR